MKKPFSGGYEEIEIISSVVLKDLHKSIKGYTKFETRDFLLKAVKSLGGKIKMEKEDYPFSIWNPLVIKPDKTFTIILGGYTTRYQDNFLIAQYLGNIFLSYKIDKRETKRETVFYHLEKKIYWASHYFALVFLMPEKKLIKKLNEYKKLSSFERNQKLAGDFEVPVKKVEERIKKLSLKSWNTYQKKLQI